MRFHANTFYRISIISAALVIAFELSLPGCLPKKDNPAQNDSTPTQSPSDKVLQFATARSQQSGSWCQLLELVSEPVGGSHNIDSARAYWRQARNQYEQARFAIEEFDPSDHQSLAAWFTTPNLKTGFHFIEMNIFSPAYNFNTVEPPAAVMFSSLQAIVPSALKNAGISDAGTFRGLQYMLADIDSIKFSGLDSIYSNNSYNDIFSNYTGLDSVYSYYQDSVRRYSPAVDSLFTGQLLSARTALQVAGSMAGLNKQLYRTQYLYPLDTALKQVAKVFGVQLQ